MCIRSVYNVCSPFGHPSLMPVIYHSINAPGYQRSSCLISMLARPPVSNQASPCCSYNQASIQNHHRRMVMRVKSMVKNM